MGTPGQLIWSVNLSAHDGDISSAQALQAGAEATLEVLRRHRMPATWTAPEPAQLKPLCGRIAEAGHELGLLGDSDWIGAGRTKFVNELTRRSEAARAAGLPISCLATGGAPLDHNLDILVRQRISTIRVDGAQWGMASSRRFGIWQLSVSDVVPGRRGLGGGRLGYQRLIRQCARHRQTMLLVIEASAMADRSRVRLLDRLCRTAARQSQLAICPFAEVARRMLAGSESAGAGSILRAA